MCLPRLKRGLQNLLQSSLKNIESLRHALYGAVFMESVLSVTGKQDKAEIKEIEEMIVLLVRNFMRGWVACSDNNIPSIQDGCHL
jgi:hypothetical protein